ncbi:MAG: threonine/homoserine/homoserine lactone efflux protein [Alphaproteobacteria bacterium]|jgi:threonine/homoserine/homoserine lactone efflux protein
MSFDTWLLYLGTILLFMSTPGPSHLLMISVSMSNGFSRSLATAAGDLSANAIQIVLAGQRWLLIRNMDLQLSSG